ncbi:MAG: TetR/AcrR family transcriptional regulator [Thermoleophilaceae bacterium]
MSTAPGAASPPLGSGPPTPKGRRTQRRILDAARAVFARSGYVGARMSDVADEAGLSMGGLYRYFGNKEELFAQLVAGLHDELFETSTGGETTLADDPEATLLAANRGYLHVYAENRDVMRALIEAANVDDRFREQWWRMRARHVERFLWVWQSAGATLEEAEALLVTEALAAMVEESAYIWFAHGDADGREVDVDAAARAVTHIWRRAFFD